MLLPNIGKLDSFIESDFWKMTYFLENIIAKTNRALEKSMQTFSRAGVVGTPLN